MPKHKRKWTKEEEKGPASNEAKKIKFEPRTPNQRKYFHTIKNNDITLCTGCAGVGKTYVPIAYGLSNLMCAQPKFDKIVIVRSVIESFGEELGYLKGSAEDKLLPFLGSILDNLQEFISLGAIEILFKRKKIEMIHLGHLRGRSLNNCFIIAEEAQNLSPEKILTILTRMGENSKLVISGDVNQCDLKHHETSGLLDAIEKLKGMKGVGICKLTHHDIVRNKILGEILMRYGKLDLEDQFDSENEGEEPNFLEEIGQMEEELLEEGS